MTPENQKIREALKTAESVIVAALATQPEGDTACRQHLEKAVCDVRRIVGVDGGIAEAK